MKHAIVAMLVSLLGVLGALGSCKSPNPLFCCVDEADCASVGAAEIRLCGGGLACLGHQCVEEACVTDADCTTAEATVCRDGLCHKCDATHGCASSAPVCDLDADSCGSCSSDPDCASQQGAPRCNPSGACVECLTSMDCTTADKSVCDLLDGTCRACVLDPDCASGACADDGTCVDETSIVYVDVGGVDAGDCTKLAPCQTIEFAITKTRPARERIVMAPGGYVSQDGVGVSSQRTTASHIVFHGHGASLTGGQFLDGSLLVVSLPTEVRDLALVSPGNTAIASSAELKLRRVHVQGSNGINASGHVIAEDLKIDVTSLFAIIMRVGSRVTIDGGVLRGGDRAIDIDAVGGSFEITNVVIYETRLTAIDAVSAVNSSMNFCTIANVGASSATRPKAVECGSGVAIRSSIVWTPGDDRNAVLGCAITSSIVGPKAIAGVENADPLFVAPSSGDFGLLPGSPARDRFDSGPATDVLETPRPQGPRYDMGAVEGRP